MFYLVSTLNVTDVDGVIETSKSYAQEHNYAQDHQNEFGVVEHFIYGSVEQNIVIIVNGYKTREEAQKHKAGIEAPHMQAGLEQMGIKSYDMWLTERRVALSVDSK